MTDEQIDTIRERLKAATDGPWEAHDEGKGGCTLRGPNGEHIGFFHPFSPDDPPRQSWMNARFAAHAPSDIAYLLERLEAAEAVVEEAETLLDHGDTTETPYRLLERLRTALEEYEEEKQ